MKILLIGCGHMGGAMLAGWLRHPGITRIDVVDPSAPPHPDPRVHIHASLTDIAPDIAVLAVKPQVMKDVCVALAPHLDEKIPTLSIAAGITLTNMARWLGANRPLVRSMPNTPGAIGEGITAFIKNDKVKPDHMDAAVLLLSALGDVIEVSEESAMDAVTALSGSGPAYIFYLTEALEKAGINAGLSPAQAAQLARKTVIGAAGLLKAQPDQTPEMLRKAVTSPGGTTAAALGILGKNRALETLVNDAVAAAAQKSKDLAQSQ